MTVEQNALRVLKYCQKVYWEDPKESNIQFVFPRIFFLYTKGRGPNRICMLNLMLAYLYTAAHEECNRGAHLKNRN